MIAELRGKFAGLSMNKHGSNVVEDLLRCSNQDDVHAIVKELMRSTNFLEVIQDPFGNYVVQRALKCTKVCISIFLKFSGVLTHILFVLK